MEHPLHKQRAQTASPQAHEALHGRKICQAQKNNVVNNTRGALHDTQLQQVSLYKLLTAECLL